MDLYNINGQTPVRVENIGDWNGFMDDIQKRRVGYTDVNDEIAVSTVFLGLDHAIPGFHSEPRLFETMIMGGPNDGYQERYATWEQAEAGHARIVKIAAEPMDGEGEG